jgi:uncharacterized protein (TIGR01777 family)
MHVFVTGGTGFIGTHLVRALVDRGDTCTVISRSGRDRWLHSSVSVIKADPVSPGAWQEAVSGAEGVINLAGERIFELSRRWTQARKNVLRASRVTVTRNVVQAVRSARERPAVLLSGSAIGYYGARGDDTVDESADPGNDFLANLAAEWESAALELADSMPVVLLRTGIVLGRHGGALQPLVTLFKTGLGGPWGNGGQWWSWIHLADQVGLILFALDQRLSGAVNLTAPNPVTVNEFARLLGKALRRPALLRAPEFVMRTALGEAATALFDLQRVVPRRALEAGYDFRFQSLAPALVDLVGKEKRP